MQFDFDTPVNRRGTDSLKWDVSERELPMWVADMDFKTAPAVIRAVEERAAMGVYGYGIVPPRWYDAYVHWWQKRHDFRMEKDWLCFTTGVVPAISSMVKRLTNIGDRVVLMTPVYDIFFHSVENAGRTVSECPLLYDGNRYAIDFAGLEERLSHPLATLMILCNPHNPVGMVFTGEELARIGALCQKHGVTVIADEIHCDLTDPGVSYTPFLSASPVCREIGIACLSASKAFNLAGMQSAAVAVPAVPLRNKVVRGLNSDEVAEPNCFAVASACAAFEEGAEWLDALRSYLAGNKRYASDYIRENCRGIRPLPQNATYLLWLDCAALSADADGLGAFIRQESGLYLSAGSVYRGNGGNFLRLNTACPRKTLQEGLSRLSRSVAAYRG